MQNKNTLFIAAFLIIVAVGYLMISNTANTAQYFLTIAELSALGTEAQNRNLTVSGAVLGDTIVYDEMEPQVTFTIVHIPGKQKEIEAQGGLARVLYEATHNPDAQRLDIVYPSVKPDLLKNEAQAIVRGQLGDDGRFYADEVLLKCPSRYEPAVPDQTGE